MLKIVWKNRSAIEHSLTALNSYCSETLKQHARKIAINEGASKTFVTKKQTKILLIIASIMLLLMTLELLFFAKILNVKNENKSFRVLVAAKDILEGSVLETESFNILEMSLAGGADRFMLKEEQQAKWYGRRLRINIPAGSPIQSFMFYSNLLAESAAEKIPPGKRLYLLKNIADEVFNLVHRNDIIDVIGHLQLPEKGLVIKTLLSGIRIVAVGVNNDENINNSEKDMRALSIHVTPEELQFLLQAEKFGKLSVAIRNPSDHNSDNTNTGMTINRFLEDPRIRDVFRDDLFQIRRGVNNAKK